MYKHPNTHISKQIHTEAYKGGLNLKKSRIIQNSCFVLIVLSEAKRGNDTKYSIL